jgi:DNA modification methylase
VVKKQAKPIKQIKNDTDNRIDEYTDKDTVEEIVEQTEFPEQRDFYKIPRRFGSIPVDKLPLGCDKEYQYRKIYPRIPLPFQIADHVTFGHPNLEPNRLFWGDNLHVMRMLPSNSIDLIYIDPPFFSGTDYNVLFGDQNEIRSFSDIWEGGMPSYLIWLNARLVEMKRLLKPTGSIYVHLDWHALHYVKEQLDRIFGSDNFRREIIWALDTVSGFKSKTNNWIRGHDTILYYTKTSDFKFNKLTQPHKAEYIKRFKKKDKDGRRYRDDRSGGRRQYLEDTKGRFFSDVWTDVMSFQQAATSSELIGYPTQKPEKLLERIIKSSSNEGDVVADFFSGGGTTATVAQKLNRKWIACDQSRVAVSITQGRLETVYEKEDLGGQQTLSKVPDVLVEYWGTYEVSGLEELTQEEFSDFIVTSFGGRSSSAGNTIHGYKRETPIFVGSSKQNIPITKEDVITFAEEITKTKGKFQGIMLGWSFAQSARIAVEKLIQEGDFGVDLIQISQIGIESSEFRKHITKLHNEYESFLKFILPPEVIVNHKRVKSMTYEFDASESIPLNEDSTIVNVQWDFKYLGRFTPTQGFAYGRDEKSKPLLNVQYKFERLGKTTIACRVQDDLGGEKIYTEVISVK